MNSRSPWLAYPHGITVAEWVSMVAADGRAVQNADLEGFVQALQEATRQLDNGQQLLQEGAASESD